MRKFFQLFISIVFVFSFFLLTSGNVHAQASICNDWICNYVYYGIGYSPITYQFHCGGQPNHKIVDKVSGQTLTNATFAIHVNALDGTGAPTVYYLPTKPTNNGIYEYWAVSMEAYALKIWPFGADGITFSAPGYKELSYPLNNLDPCSTSPGSPVDYVPLESATTKTACIGKGTTVNDATAECRDIDATQCQPETPFEGGKIAKCFDSVPACQDINNDGCQVLFIIDQGNGQRLCVQKEIAAKSPIIVSGPYFYYSACQAVLTTGLGATPIPKPTSTPVPTHAPAVPPHCAEGAFDPDTWTCSAVDSAIGPIPTRIGSFINRLIGFLIGIGAGIAVLIIIYAGYKLMTSQGNPEAIQNAKDLITSAIVGILFLVFSIIILEVIGVDILKIPFWNK